MSNLSIEDKLATLAAFTACTIAKSSEHFPHEVSEWYIAGGGRHNAVLMQLIAKYTKSEVKPIEELGHDGDALEAEAFAYLAVRRYPLGQDHGTPRKHFFKKIENIALKRHKSAHLLIQAQRSL